MPQITKKRKRRPCKTCHKKFWWISQNNYCKNCMQEKVELARLQIKHKQGPIYDKYKMKMLQALEK